MNKKLKAKWVKALRSGRYKQTQGNLAIGKGPYEMNCCLGVLCRVAHEPRTKWEDCTDLSDAGMIPEIGITDKQETALIKLNDGKDANGRRIHTFAEIADYIEGNL